ncbi:MAG: 3-hydroxyacyl-ACP dehydratase FabZ family protein [Planctomycetota bacterium]|jgi:3-hydroxyacyl-[acyl-carrier-protein] dehydratase
MPPPLLFDLGALSLDEDVLTKDQIYENLPQRHQFSLLDGISHLDRETRTIVAYRKITNDDWWIPGHVPGRPLLPGVLMLEMAAQASALMVKLFGHSEAFIGFGGVNRCKFREAVAPGVTLHLLALVTDLRSRRVVSEAQGVVDGKLIFEAEITGLVMQ